MYQSLSSLLHSEIVLFREQKTNSRSAKKYTAVDYEGIVKVNGKDIDVSRRVYQRDDMI